MSKIPYYPFMLLKALRDGSDLRTKLPPSFMDDILINTPVPNPYSSAVDQLLSAGLVRYVEGKGIEAHQAIREIFRAVGISLTALEKFNEDSIICNPRFGPVGDVREIDIFVLMPFSERMNAIYEDHIRAVAGKLDLSIARGDDVFTTHSVMTDVWTGINGAKIVVADCTGRSANVFYEMGIAHTLGKPVVCLAQDPADIPFDIQHLRYIIYEYTPRGMLAFEEALGAAIRSVGLSLSTAYPKGS